MLLSGKVLFSLWLAGATAAWYMRPQRLFLTGPNVPLGKRLGIALLTLIYSFAVPTFAVFAFVAAEGFIRGLIGS